MMERTPDDVKKGLEYISIKDVARKLDAWEDGIPYDYVEDAAADALDLIQQLQAENAQQARCIENMTDKLNAMNDEVAKLQAERDAAVRDVRKWCCTCKHCAKEVRKAPCNSCRRNGQGGTEECWEWHGVSKEE